MGGTKFVFLLLVGCLPCLYCIPVDGGIVAIADPSPSDDKPADPVKEDTTTEVTGEVKITEMHVKSEVANRFARTIVTSKVKNFANVAKETTFFVVLPEDAYIGGFIMEIGGKNYTAYVEEKEKAKKTYDDAVASGQGAAHVAVSARDSNKFTVTMNIEPESKAAFYLTYEQLLKRIVSLDNDHISEKSDGKYELIININPKQIVDDMTVEVEIEESKDLTFVKAPQIRTGNEIIKESEDLDPRATIVRPENNKAIITFKPNPEKQKQIAHGLGKDEKEGIAGQFVVQYDVVRDPSGGEVIVKNGYFVHFFAPAEQKPLKKHVVFVLDTSGSMYGQKMTQLKQAMVKILGEAYPQDFFNVVEFNTNVKVHNLNAPSESTQFPDSTENWYNDEKVFDLAPVSFPPAYPANPTTKAKANQAVTDMNANGGTNIYEALRVGLHMIELRKQRNQDSNVQSIIFFLTDGDPTVGITNQDKIIAKISEINIHSVPIISLSFGTGADKTFLEKLSLNNHGFSRFIYEDLDASLQLEQFYQEVSSPLLHNIKFKYVDDANSLTITEFPIYFRGSEFVVAGKIPDDKFYEVPRVECIGIIGPIIFNTTVTKSVGQLERLWAYLTVQKTLDAKKTDETKTKELDKQALDLSLKYSLVTPLTSLVVVKPNSTSTVDTSKADGSGQESYANYGPLASFSGAPGGFGGGASYPAAPPVQFAPTYASTTYQYSGFAQSVPQSGSLLPIAGGVGAPASYGPDFDGEALEETTPAVPTPAPEPVKLPEEYKPELAWLEKHLNPDGSLDFFKGNFQLGFNATSPTSQACTTLDSEDGLCKLVKDCPKLRTKLVDEQVFKDNFCSIDEKYAGVCCL